MNVGEILRKVADVVDSDADRSSQEQEILRATHQAEISGAVTASNELQAGQVAQLVQAASNMKSVMGAAEAQSQSIVPTFPGQASVMGLTSADNTDGTCNEKMVSPLQQQHELLKKSQGVENNVSEFADNEGRGQVAVEGRDDMPDGGELAFDKDIVPNDNTGSHDRADHDKFMKLPGEEEITEECGHCSGMNPNSDDANDGYGFCRHCGDDLSPDTDEIDENDDLARMKKMAGIGVTDTGAPVDHALDCRPVSMNPRAVAATKANGKQDARLQHTLRRKF